jgi:hypothetical protein
MWTVLLPFGESRSVSALFDHQAGEALDVADDDPWLAADAIEESDLAENAPSKKRPG